METGLRELHFQGSKFQFISFVIELVLMDFISRQMTEFLLGGLFAITALLQLLSSITTFFINPPYEYFLNHLSHLSSVNYIRNITNLVSTYYLEFSYKVILAQATGLNLNIWVILWHALVSTFESRFDRSLSQFGPSQLFPL